MGAEDIRIKCCLGVEARFADLFNVLLFQGKEVLTPDMVKKIDGESGLVYRAPAGRTMHVKRYRDILMQAELQGRIILLALENQKEVHYGMPTRTIMYDAMNYSEQVKVKARKNRAKKRLRSGGEYLSGLKRTDRLIPVITFVLYYGDQEWDGCKDMHNLLDLGDGIYKNLKSYIPNYTINLVDVRDIAKKGRFRTDLEFIFGILQYKDDAEKVKHYIKEHAEYFNSVDADTFGALTVMLGATNILEAPKVEGGRVDMCKALEDIYQEGKTDGKVEGKIEGKAEGKAEAVLELLQEYGEVPEEVQRCIISESNMEVLKLWLKTAARAGSIEAFTQSCAWPRFQEM